MAVASCTTKSSVDQSIEAADKAIANGEYGSSQQVCDEIVGTNGLDSLSAAQLCRLSVIFLRLSEQSNEQENTAAAVECYRAANSISPDSVALYFNALPVEDLQYMAILRSLTSSTDADTTAIIIDDPYEITDSIF